MVGRGSVTNFALPRVKLPLCIAASVCSRILLFRDANNTYRKKAHKSKMKSSYKNNRPKTHLLKMATACNIYIAEVVDTDS